MSVSVSASCHVVGYALCEIICDYLILLLKMIYYHYRKRKEDSLVLEGAAVTYVTRVSRLAPASSRSHCTPPAPAVS